MTCHEVRLALLALLDDELEVTESLPVLAHLETCAGCHALAERDRRLAALLRTELSAGPPAPAGLWQQVSDRLDAEDGRREQDRRRPWTRRLLAGMGALPRRWTGVRIAAVAAVVVAALVLLVPLRPASSLLAEEILADHLRSVGRATGPVDLVTADPSVVVSRLHRGGPAPSAIPVLEHAGSQLVGGSFCRFRSTSGLRFTYAVAGDRTVSVYQLERPRQAPAPAPGGRPLFIRHVAGSPGPGVILWGDEQFVYALVGDMPAPALEQLANAMRPIAPETPGAGQAPRDAIGTEPARPRAD